MAKAVQALQSKNVNRIILTRPAVEAGERLGFLPGTLSEKIDPYLRPLYDALHDMLDPETIPKLLAAGTIEVAPLAYMRGRTLNDAFIILDEAQNTSPEQMKMFLTRLGFGSKMVVTGDVTQVDLPSGHEERPARSSRSILDGIEDVSFNRLTAHDVVRHRLVGHIVAAYDEYEARRDEQATRAPTVAPAAGPGERDAPDEHRGPQRVRRRASTSRGLSRLVPLRDGPDARAPAGRAVHQARRRGHHRRAQRAVDGARRARPTCWPSRWTSCGPGLVNEEPEEGVLGDLVLCPAVAAASRPRRAPATPPRDEVDLLTVHGILHLLGYDHAEPEEHREMFGLQARLLAEWQGARSESPGERRRDR